MEVLEKLNYIDKVKNRGKNKNKFNPNQDIEGILIYKLPESDVNKFKSIVFKNIKSTLDKLLEYNKKPAKGSKRPNFRTEITKEFKNIIRENGDKLLNKDNCVSILEEGNIEDESKVLTVFQIEYAEDREIYIEIRDMWINIEFTNELTSDLFTLNGIMLKNLNTGKEGLENLLDNLLGAEELQYNRFPEFKLSRQNIIDMKNDRFKYLNIESKLE